MRKLITFSSGLIFGLGLILSDMVDPSRVRAFLDLFGNWDPTLAFVMGGAVIVSIIAWRVAGNLEHSFTNTSFPSPMAAKFDFNLIAGSALFGIGWGMVGICPGPGIVAMVLGGWQIWVFVAAMIIGMSAWNIYQDMRTKNFVDA